MEIAPELLDRIVAHAQRDAPDECCGIVLARDGVAFDVVELENLQPSPFRFEVDPLEVFKRSDDTETLGAIYHSHTRSAPEPSQTDINFAQGWPGVEWIIVGLKGPDPDVRSWLITGPDVVEVPVAVTDPT